jgi:hypothetical protein
VVLSDLIARSWRVRVDRSWTNYVVTLALPRLPLVYLFPVVCRVRRRCAGALRGVNWAEESLFCLNQQESFNLG